LREDRGSTSEVGRLPSAGITCVLHDPTRRDLRLARDARGLAHGRRRVRAAADPDGARAIRSGWRRSCEMERRMSNETPRSSFGKGPVVRIGVGIAALAGAAAL